MIELRDVDKSYDGGRTHVVKNLDLTIKSGEILILLGESGCGKTTTLRMINRLVDPTGGEILIDGDSVADRDPVELRREIGYVIQRVGLLPHFTIAENVAVVPRLLDWEADKTSARVDELLELIGLPAAQYGDRYPAQLSGGQRQRIGLARALAARPNIVLMDEPFGALDPITRDELQVEFKRLQRELEVTAVIVTHDMTEAVLLGDRIAVMSGGKIMQLGTPRQLLLEPADDYVAALMSKPKEQADAIERIIDEGAADAAREEQE